MSWEKRVYAVLATHIMKQLIAKQIVNEKSLGGIILRPKNRKESRTEILSKSFKNNRCIRSTIREISSRRTWNKVHVVEYEHPLGKVAMLRKYLM
jgi:penicillin amidase